MLKIDDRVMVSRSRAALFNRRSCGIDWVERRGKVVRISGDRTAIFVIWDGRKSPDQWPAAAIEKAE